MSTYMFNVSKHKQILWLYRLIEVNKIDQIKNGFNLFIWLFGYKKTRLA